ncbi:hypothetical protein [Endozoicomonas sp. Mp262]|uniref:inositol monophosphatase family protein n=1 Tax=Endozoicomonas sp. Mp262 TaxID=2919499 RepID=UPI0021DA21DA
MFAYKSILTGIWRCFLLCSMISIQAYAGNDKLTDEEVGFLVEVAVEAGKRIQKNWLENRLLDEKDRSKYRYQEPDKENEQLKPDGSSVTSADKESDDYINKLLSESKHRRLRDLPRISEESKYPSLDKRKKYERYILIDPLDGTSKFKKGEVEKVSVFIVVLDKVDDDRGGAKPIFSILHRPFERSSGDVGEGLMVEDGVTLYGGEDYGIKVRYSGEEKYTLDKDEVPVTHLGQLCSVTVTESTLNSRLSHYLQKLGCEVDSPEELSGELFTVDGFSVEPELKRLPSVSKFFAMIGMTERGQHRIVRQATENIHAHICLGISEDKESDQTQKSWAPEEVDVAVMHALGIPLGIHFYDINGDELRYNKRKHLKMGHHIGLAVKADGFRELFPKELWSEEVVEGKGLEDNGNDSE